MNVTKTIRPIKRNVLWMLMLVLSFAGIAHADGMLVPIDDEVMVQGSWAVKYHRVDIEVDEQLASVTIEQEFVNTGSGMIEVEYLFPVPPGAGIDSLTLTVNDEAFAAEMLPADQARAIYEDIVRRKKDPALLEYAGYGLYRTKAFPLEKDTPVTMQVTYKMLCPKNGESVEVFYPLNTEKFSSKAIEEVSVTVDITSATDVTGWYSPTHDIKVERKAAGHVIATMKAENVIPKNDFSMYYTVSNKDVGASLLTATMPGEDNGYFLLMVSPNPSVAEDEDPMPKDIIVVLDRSGSMSGDKIKQARGAAKFIVERLNEGDRFNVITYASGVTPMFESMTDYTDESKDDAVSQIEIIEGSGSTNIHAALKEAMSQLEAARADDDEDARPAYIIFLTDGLATAGKTAQADIVGDIGKANTGDARLFTFGVGYDVNVQLLDKLSEENAGASDYVKPAEDIEDKVSTLYKRIKNPVLTDIEVELKGVRLLQQHPPTARDLFADDQLVLTGRFVLEDVRKLGDGGRDTAVSSTKIIITGKVRGEEMTFEYPVRLDPTSEGKPFVAKLWAMRQIGYLLDQIQLNGESDEVVDELIALSTQYGIITPYTSFLAREDVALNNPADVRTHADVEVAELQETTDGFDGQNSATTRNSLKWKSRPAADMDATTEPTTQVEGNTNQVDYEAGETETLATVQNVGNRAVYFKRGQWVDSSATDIDPEDEDADIIEVDRMSDEYFELTRLNTVEENQVLATQQGEEALLIRLRGQAYLIR
jgi:Ca-activated chloride channel homolog